MPIPKDLASKFIPNIGDLFEVGLAGVGVTVVDFTAVVNTALTDAELIAAPPNTAGFPTGVVVHSLGVAPTVAFVQPVVQGGDIAAGLDWGVQYAYMTGNASAAFFRAKAWTGAIPRGQHARMIAIR